MNNKQGPKGKQGPCGICPQCGGTSIRWEPKSDVSTCQTCGWTNQKVN